MEKQMNEIVQIMLNKISDDDRREMIAKSRWTCDSHWMMSMVMNAGWDVANEMNLQVAKTVGHVEMHRLMKAMNLIKPINIEDFMMLLTMAMETFVTKDYFDYEFYLKDSGEKIGIIHQCYANTKLRSIGAKKDYQCGCFGLRAGWYQAMDVEVKEKMLKCLKDGDERCEILIEDIVFPS